MEENKLNFDLQDYWQNRDKLHDLLSEYLIKHPQTLVGFAKTLGITFITLKKILNKQTVDFKVWCKVFNFLKK